MALTFTDLAKYYPQVSSLCDDGNLETIQARLDEAECAISEDRFGDLTLARRMDYAALRIHESGCLSLFSDAEYDRIKGSFDMRSLGTSVMVLK